MIDQIKHLHLQGYKIKKIAAILGVSKNTVRRYVRNDAATGESKAASTVVTDLSVDWDYVKSQYALGRPLKRVYEEILPNFTYSHFTRMMRKLSPPEVKTAPRIHHEPGENTQVDYCDGLLIYDPKTNKATKTQFFCGVLPASSFTFGEFSMTQKSFDFLRSHERMWAFFGGVSKYVVIDNLKSGVSRAHRYDPDINPAYCDFGNHCGFAVLPARVRTPRDKASVEAAIGAIQRDFFERHRNTKFYSLAELNAAFYAYLQELNNRVMTDHGASRADRFVMERPKLGPLPSTAYEIYEWKDAKVHPDCCIELNRSVYSVPFTHVGKQVKVKYNEKLVIILDLSGLDVLATHVKQARFQASIQTDHLPEHKIQRKCFDLVKIERIAKSIGEKTYEYVMWQMELEKYPLRALRRLQGIIRFFETKKIAKASMEFAATRAMSYRRKDLRYFSACAENFQPGAKNLHVVTAPTREMTNIHLQQ